MKSEIKTILEAVKAGEMTVNAALLAIKNSRIFLSAAR